SLLERVIEEKTKGEPGQADAVRRTLMDAIGIDLSAVRPGSGEAAKVKDLLVQRGLWSPYLEVGIGPDAEVFTKSQPMSAVGRRQRRRGRPASGLDLEQPGARDRAGRERARRDRWRDARQRREPPRFRGPQRAPARQGQGQQRLLCHRTVHPPV